ncbi:MAG: TAT-variant-translocated molybdopterin oxidoreductase [Chitinophagaceae bacterium]|nr:TAT-variant-translocated molybdopterin oxidoreductase [Chitinophagaceae bacterium]
MSDKKYWQSFSELANSEEYEKKIQNEFQEELPFEDANGKGWLDASAPRRDFLKYLGFSTAAATLASCKTPVRKAIPFANKPENVVPGVAKYYATTYVQDGDVIPVLAKVRDGRPIKIEGNTLCSFTEGGTSARAQASVLDLYDTNRLRHPKERIVKGDTVSYEEVPSFEKLDKTIAEQLAALGTGKAVLLTSTLVSPSTKALIAQFPNIQHVQFDADSYSGMLLANEASFGSRAIPSYHFSKAKVVVSLGADFLATWLSPVEFSRGWSKTRKINEKNPEMGKHYQFESHMSTTGANADERFTHRPSETGAVALALYAALGGTASATVSDNVKKGIAKAAADLKAHMGNALVVSGSNDVNVQLIVNAINSLIGAYGTTIDWSSTLNYRQGIDSQMEQLVADMEAGTVGALMVHGANPVYEYHNADKFKKALAKVKLTVSFGEKLDETSELCKYIIPTHHFLESWGDAEPKSGYYSFIQPTIHPLFKTRYMQTSLLKWFGDGTDYETYFRNYWTGKVASLDAALQNGVVEPAAGGATSGSFNGAGVAAAAAAIGGYKKGGAAELVLYQKVSIGTGKQATNPWLQELPDPITKATWDNYAMMSMTMAKELLGLDLTDKKNEKEINNYEFFPSKPVISIKGNGGEAINLPVLVIPGMDPHTIAIAVGYGRSEKLGMTAGGTGKNVFGFKSFNGITTEMMNASVEVAKVNETYKIAQTQIHGSYEDRFEVVRETTLATFKKDPNQFKKYREKLAEDFAPKTGDYRKEATIYPQHTQPGLKWGMSIDMNSCFGCGACVVACNAENNIPVVGRSEVMRYHDMHWLRIDRYFVTDEQNPDDVKAVVFQPMLCQHCDNAPCENVCPVAATNHSMEGLNQMTYNRCIGTRYCANNCPYKVRRFNWADYTGADSFPNNQDQQIVGKLDPVVHQMGDSLSRMVLNPDVTVRSRGVIEKCSFCVQRLQEAKLTAKKENRVLADGDAKTACMTACPSDAIVFGNVHDAESRITKVREENDQRLFYVIEQLHTLPNVSYLAKIRNTEEIIESGDHHAAAEGEAKKTEHAAPAH